MIDAHQLHDNVVKPTLIAFGKTFSQPAARALVMGTIAHESLCGRYIKQGGNGPALGIVQMEPATHDDIWNHYLRYQPDIRQRLQSLFDIQEGDSKRLLYDLRYNVIMCRLHYRRVKDKLPDVDDIRGLAEYWKDHYNTHQGKGTVQQFIDHYQHYIGEVL